MEKKRYCMWTGGVSLNFFKDTKDSTFYSSISLLSAQNLTGRSK